MKSKIKLEIIVPFNIDELDIINFINEGLAKCKASNPLDENSYYVFDMEEVYTPDKSSVVLLITSEEKQTKPVIEPTMGLSRKNF